MSFLLRHRYERRTSRFFVKPHYWVFSQGVGLVVDIVMLLELPVTTTAMTKKPNGGREYITVSPSAAAAE